MFIFDLYCGGYSWIVDVELGGGFYLVDVGFMVFNERMYLGFCELLSCFDVEFWDSDMSFSVWCGDVDCEY